MKKIFIALLSTIAVMANAQTDSSKSSLTFSGYAEVYYSYDFGNPANHERPSFFYPVCRSPCPHSPLQRLTVHPPGPAQSRGPALPLRP